MSFSIAHNLFIIFGCLLHIFVCLSVCLFVCFRLRLFFALHLKQSTLTEESKSAYNLLIEKPSVETTSLPAEPAAVTEPEDSNPLRMLRSGGLTVVRPKIRGNKHQLQTLRDSRELKVQQQLREFFLLFPIISRSLFSIV